MSSVTVAPEPSGGGKGSPSCKLKAILIWRKIETEMIF